MIWTHKIQKDRFRDELNEEGRLSHRSVRDILHFMGYRWEHFDRLRYYYEGTNWRILHASKGRDPQSVSYGRKIINTVSGYMYKPGSIKFTHDDERYLDELNEVRNATHDDIVTAETGKETSIYGVGYELHYTDDDGMPRYVVVPSQETLAIYSRELGDDEPIAAVRWYVEDEQMQRLDIYYSDVVHHFIKKKGSSVPRPQSTLYPDEPDEEPHDYGRVPVVEYENNRERAGDFAHVLPLIDAYDALMTDSVFEIEKLAEAYLVLTNASIPENDVDKMRAKRIIELYEGGKAEFLTKNVDPSLLQFMRDWIRREIHQQSQVPDMSDEQFAGQQSGIAIRYKLQDLENLCAAKESWFRKGLHRRIQLLDAVIQAAAGTESDGQVEITFTRNIPTNYVEIANIIERLRGHVSHQTILDKIVPFVDDPAEEIERLKDEEDVYPTEPDEAPPTD